MTQTTAADGSVTQTIYNSIGKVDHTVDALGRITQYTYDEQGRLVKTQYPDGTYESETYDANGNRAVSTDKAGRVTKYVYDTLDRLIETDEYGIGNSILTATKSALDDDSESTGEMDANGNTTAITYDDLGRTLASKDGFGTTVDSDQYDLDGRMTSSTDANSHSTSMQYDNAGEQLSTTYADSSHSSNTYDVLGRKVTSKDQNGLNTTYNYDTLGRLTSVVSPMNHIETYTYDELGEKLSQTDANGHTTTFSYDLQGRLISKMLPAGQSMSMTYNADGTLATTTDYNGFTTVMLYDQLGRLIAKRSGSSTGALLASESYNPDGTLASEAKGNVTVSYTYDQLGRTASATTTNAGTGGIATTVSYTYDAAGNKKTQSAASGTLTYDYDADERLSTVHYTAGLFADENASTIIASYSYDLVGNRHSVSLSNSVTSNYVYDSLNRLLNLTNAKSGSILSSSSYTLDPNGRRTSVTDQTNATTSYTYDNDNRLIGESSSALGNVVYQYDNVGNRLHKLVNGSTNQSFTYDADDHVQNSGYSYDSNGNVLADGTNKYAYDWDNKMISSGLVTGNPTAFYTYDPDGLRVQEASSSSTTNFTNDPNSGYGNVVEERDQNANLVARYDYGDDLIDEQRQPTGTSFYLFDGHGSTVNLTNTNGAITDSYSYDAFGNLIAKTGTTPNSYLYNAQCQDGTTGLYYLRARYMDPTRGEFEGMDPFDGNDEELLSLHRYLYGYDRPVDRVDPSGRDPLADVTIASSEEFAIDGVSSAVELGARSLATDVAEKVGIDAITDVSEDFVTDMTEYLNEGTPFEELTSTETGQFFDWIGAQAESFMDDVIEDVLPDAEVEADEVVGESGPGKIIDRAIKFRNKVLRVESKYSLPWKKGEQLTRLVNQVTYGAAKGQTVLFTLVKPGPAQLQLLQDVLGDTYGQITIASGAQALAHTLIDFFGP